MEEKRIRNKKQDILSIWKEFPYLGDVRKLDSLKIFAPYPIYKTEIELMAQMRIILMSEYHYYSIKPYLEKIKDNDDILYDFVVKATDHYLKSVQPKYEKHRIEDFTESINFVRKENEFNDEHVKIFNIQERT